MKHSRIVAYRDCGLSYRSIAARIGRDPMTVSRIWNRWVQDDNTESRAVSQRSSITSSREDRHVTHIALMDRAATSQALSQEFRSFSRQKVLHELFDDVYSCMNSQLGNHGYFYP
ncbi:HTH_Tnp_Tc3_2 domain-containing protein [Trichonephila clavipes]|nr:HTH_Tnp_Tc3_2 domain-containing protein [Trichonephila clavipes]